jgi:hypothetical protein
MIQDEMTVLRRDDLRLLSSYVADFDTYSVHVKWSGSHSQRQAAIAILLAL